MRADSSASSSSGQYPTTEVEAASVSAPPAQERAETTEEKRQKGTDRGGGAGCFNGGTDTNICFGFLRNMGSPRSRRARSGRSWACWAFFLGLVLHAPTPLLAALPHDGAEEAAAEDEEEMLLVDSGSVPNACPVVYAPEVAIRAGSNS